MAKHKQGRFVVSPLDDGRFVAASNTAPYFCFRGTSEEEVLDKVRRAVTFCQTRTAKGAIEIKPLSQTITSVSGRPYDLNEIVAAA